MKVRVELGRISDKGAQRCLNGGLVAGLLACSLEEARQAAGSTFGFHPLWTAIRQAERQATLLRKAFTKSPEAREIRDRLRAWEKSFKKESRKDVLAQIPPIGATQISALKGLLGKAIEDGAAACGKSKIPYQIERHFMDLMLPPERKDFKKLEDIPDTGKEPGISGRSRRRGKRR